MRWQGPKDNVKTDETVAAVSSGGLLRLPSGKGGIILLIVVLRRLLRRIH